MSDSKYAYDDEGNYKFGYFIGNTRIAQPNEIDVNYANYLALAMAWIPGTTGLDGSFNDSNQEGYKNY